MPMKSRRHFSSVWIAFLLGAGAILIWNTAARIHRLDYLSTIGAPAENHTGGVLPIPDQLDASYHWLAQTQRMLNRGEARVRHIDYENAPFGRTVLTPSPYRWWLGFLAWCEHLATGAPSRALVEKAALLADPSQRVFAPVIDGLAGGVEHDCRFVPGNWPKFANLDACMDLHVKEEE